MRVIAVDWSGRRQGAHRYIWSAEADPTGLCFVENGRDREQIAGWLISRADKNAELVIGLDFAFSFPSWFVAEHGWADAPTLWAAVGERGEAWLADCQPPFWGRAGARRPQETDPRRHWRTTELAIPVRPKSVFQVGGAGAVGTSSIRGMPLLLRLRAAGFSVWPFDPPRLPLVVEVYPRLLHNLGSRRAANRWSWLHRRGLHEIVPDSEDAFDAAASAVVMARHADRFIELPAPSVDDADIEGAIWAPP